MCSCDFQGAVGGEVLLERRASVAVVATDRTASEAVQTAMEMNTAAEAEAVVVDDHLGEDIEAALSIESCVDVTVSESCRKLYQLGPLEL